MTDPNDKNPSPPVADTPRTEAASESEAIAVSEPIDRLRHQILARWHAYPDAERAALDAVLEDALERARGESPEVLTVMDPTSRPQRLRLATIGDRASLDSFYHNEWAELSVSHDGRLFLVYRRNDGGDYAVTWTSATIVPSDLMRSLPEPLALAMFEGDQADD